MRRCASRGKRPWLQDGPGVVYDTVDSLETIETAVRLITTGASLVVSGVEPTGRFEWTLLYLKELHVIGSNVFGIEEARGARSGVVFIGSGAGVNPLSFVVKSTPPSSMSRYIGTQIAESSTIPNRRSGWRSGTPLTMRSVRASEAAV